MKLMASDANSSIIFNFPIIEACQILTNELFLINLQRTIVRVIDPPIRERKNKKYTSQTWGSQALFIPEVQIWFVDKVKGQEHLVRSKTQNRDVFYKNFLPLTWLI